MSDGLPDGWYQTTLNATLEPGGLFDGPFGSSLKTSDYTDSGVRVIRLENLSNLLFIADKETYISEAKYQSLLKHTVYPGDILVGSFVDGAVRVCVLPNLPTKAIAKADCFTVRTRPDIADRQFAAYQLGTVAVRDAFVGDIHGATRPRITTKQLRECALSLAPLPEQHRIVEKVEALLEQVNRAKQRLDRVPLILKRFRQAVLAAACSGELTKDWRSQRQEISVAPLLRRLRLSSLDSPNLPNLPNSWVWVPFNELVVNQDGRRVPLKSEDRAKRQGKYPYYGASGIIDSIDAFIFEGDFLLIAEDGANLLSRSTPIAFQASGKFWVNNHAHVVQPREGIVMQFLQDQLNGMDLQQYVTGTAQPKLTQGALNQIPIALPPEEEQQEIVRQVCGLFSLANTIERRAKAAAARANKLPQAILSKAFSGELVPTEAELARLEGRTYETAEELLKRVTALGSDAPAAAKGRGRRGRKVE